MAVTPAAEARGTRSEGATAMHTSDTHPLHAYYLGTVRGEVATLPARARLAARAAGGR